MQLDAPSQQPSSARYRAPQGRTLWPVLLKQLVRVTLAAACPCDTALRVGRHRNGLGQPAQAPITPELAATAAQMTRADRFVMT
jgi:hypothetical protein